MEIGIRLQCLYRFCRFALSLFAVHVWIAWAYYKQVLASLRFFYRHVLRRGEVVEDIRGPRSQKRLPVVLSVEEVARFFKAIPSLKHRRF